MQDDVPSELKQQAEQIALSQGEFESKLREMKATEEKLKSDWKAVETAMIDYNVKSIKGTWGSITIAERNTFSAENLDDVPRKFIKRTIDTKKIGDTYKLEGELPKGISVKQTKYLTKRIK